MSLGLRSSLRIGATAEQRLAAALRDLDAARDRIRELERALAADFVPPEEWGLTRSEIIAVQMLLARPVVSMAALAAMLWPDPPATADDAIHGVICKLRRKLRPFAVEISNARNVGYSLVDRKAVRERWAA